MFGIAFETLFKERTDSNCLSVERRQKTAAFDGVVPHTPFRASLPPPLTLSRRHKAAKSTGTCGNWAWQSWQLEIYKMPSSL